MTAEPHYAPDPCVVNARRVHHQLCAMDNALALLEDNARLSGDAATLAHIQRGRRAFREARSRASLVMMGEAGG